MTTTNQVLNLSRDSSRHRQARRRAPAGPFLGLNVLALLVSMWASENGNCRAVETDAVRLQALEHYRIDRAWDNVAGAPLWVGGVSPQKRWTEPLYTVSLGPGQETTIRVPARSTLRVLGVHQPLTPQEIELWVSDGSGLYSKRTSAISKDRRSLLLVPDHIHAYLARVRRPAGSPSGIEVAVFTSRLELPPDPLTYRELRVALEPQYKIEQPKIQPASATKPQNYFALQPDRARVMSVDGPARIAIETRLRYPRNETRSFQTYRLRLRMHANGFQPLEHRTLEYQTSAETRLVLVDKRAEVLGRREIAYLSIPAGTHRLELDATADVYARLLSCNPDAYLWQRNRPAWLQSEFAFPQGLEGEPPSSWEITPQAAELLSQFGGEHIPLQEQLALRASRDNGHPEGGLRSMLLLQTAAAYRPDDPTVARVAEKIRGAHTFFRNLLPFEQLDGGQQFAWFSAGGLPDEDEPTEARAIAEQHIDDLLGRLSNGFFAAVGGSPAAANRYHLPADLGGTLLRVVVDRDVERSGIDAPLRMLLQYDQRKPIELELARTEFESKPTSAELALAALQWRHRGHDHGTLGGPFGQHQVPAQLIAVATTELRVPPDVREIRLWTAAGADRRVRVAVQYRASKPTQLSEGEFLAMQRRSPRNPPELFQSLLHDETARRGSTSPDDDDAVRELTNHWLPLARFLKSQRRSFEAQVVPLLPPDNFSVAADQLELDRLLQQSRQLAAEKDWLPCLEAWSDVVPHAAGGLRREGLITRTVALREMGETFLADRTLRGLYLFDSDPTVRTVAFAQLREVCRQSETTASLEQLLAAAAAATTADAAVESNVLDELTSVLLDNGDDELALTLSLVTPSPDRMNENVVRAAYRLQWWGVFERELPSLPAPHRSFWTALRSQSEGRYEQAFQLFQQGGTEGQEYAAHLAAAQAIHAGLQNANVDDRVQAIFDWERWQATHPGPRVWQDAGAMVQSHAGAESLYSIDRNLYAQFYKANRERPLVVWVQGPRNLRFECRPIHDSDAQAPLDDWIHVDTIRGHQPIAVNGNRPSSGLQIVGDADHVPGQHVSASLSLGPGLHEVRVTSDKLPLLVRAYAQQPAFPICILPALTPDTLLAAAGGGFDGASSRAAGDATFSLIPSGSADSINDLPLVRQTGPPLPGDQQRPLPRDELLAARFALRTPDALDDHAAAWEHGARQPIDYAAILAEPLPNDAAIRRRMTWLLWLAESDDSLSSECRVLGQQLFRDYPAVDGLAEMHSRLTRAGTWSRMTQLTSSAGVTTRQWPHWQPESPSLRVRKSLMASLDRTERLLFGREPTVLSMRNFEPVRLELKLSPAAVGYLPTKPLRVFYQLGESPPKWTFVERSGSTQQLDLEVPAGLQHLRVWIDQPVANHFVRLDIRDVSALVPVSTRLPDTVDFHTTERVYDVATHGEPLRMLVEGPVWLRVDELRGETTHSRYMAVLEPRREIELAPDTDREEALFRVFEFTARPGAEVPPTHWVQVAPEPLPPPLIQEPVWDELRFGQPSAVGADFAFPVNPWHDQLDILSLRAPDAPIITMDVYDSYPLGGRTDGTWSITEGAFSRRALEEGLNGRQPGQFLETRATHYRYDACSETHRQTDWLVRPRNKSGPTFGVLHRMCRPCDDCPAVFEFNASAYAQDPAGAIVPTNNDIEWSAAVRGRLRYRWDLNPDLHHTASMSVYGRVLSLNETEYLSGRVDQDIFTSYKADHLVGMTLSDTWVYQPWLDTRWWIRPSLITNEDFDFFSPDQLNLRCGWAQAIGVAEVEASYRLTWFLEDRNRPQPRLQNLLYLDVITDLPPVCQHSELAFSVQYDVVRGTASAQMNVSWFFDKRRLDRNRWPGERAFPAIRQQREASLLGQSSQY